MMLPTLVSPAYEPEVHSDVPAVPLTAMPIVVAVTGHRNVAAEAIEPLTEALRSTLSQLHERFSSLYLASGLAEGADQMAAEQAADLGIPLIGVLPMPRDIYRGALSEAAQIKFDMLWAKAVLQIELPWIGSEHSHKLQYEQLGLVFARNSNILLALWDGRDQWDLLSPERQEAVRGGTAHVVYLRQTGDQQGGVFQSSPLFPQSPSRLDMATGGPILHLLTPRDGTADTASTKAGRLLIWSDSAHCADTGQSAISWPEANGRRKVNLSPSRFGILLQGAFAPEAARSDSAWREVSNLAAEDFGFLDHIKKLNEDLARVDKVRMTTQTAYLCPKIAEDPPQPEVIPLLARLRRLQAGIDLAAQAEQRLLIGPERLRRPSAHFLFAAAVPAGVLLLELYADVWRVWWLLLIYLGIIAFVSAYYYIRVRGGEWQAKFQDYRALAEALRVQIFWALSGVSEAVADSYLRKQRDELGWITEALRGPALWSVAIALKLTTTQRSLVEECWLQDQANFFVGPDENSGKAALNARAFNRYRHWRRIFLVIAVLAVVGLLALSLRYPASHESLKKFLFVAIGVAPALAAFCTIIADSRAFEEQAQAYRRMGNLFHYAIKQATQIEASDDDAFRSLVKELGREALDENADWLREHRKRPIGFKLSG